MNQLAQNFQRPARTQYVATFNGYLKRDKPDHLPDVIQDIQLFQASSKEEYIQKVNNLTGMYVLGMSVRMHPADIQDASKANVDRVFFPMHMITHITVTVKEVAGGVTIGQQGEVLEPTGEESKSQ